MTTASGITPSSHSRLPTIYLVRGATPDGVQDWQLQYSVNDKSNVVSIDTLSDKRLDGNGTVIITTGKGNCSSLDHIQYSVRFAPALFHVSFDDTSCSVHITLVIYHHEIQGIDPTAHPKTTCEAWGCQILPSRISDIELRRGFNCNDYPQQGLSRMGNVADRACAR